LTNPTTHESPPTRGETGETSKPRGLSCSACGGKFRVVYTRPGASEKLIRRRECRECGTRITTWEQAIGTDSPTRKMSPSRCQPLSLDRGV
jgi:hypothetical protein